MCESFAMDILITRTSIICSFSAFSVFKYLIQLFRSHHIHTADRLPKHYYWSDEAPVFDDAQLHEINEKFAVDIVITHTHLRSASCRTKISYCSLLLQIIRCWMMSVPNVPPWMPFTTACVTMLTL